MLNEEVFNRGMAILGAAFPDYECSPATVDVYREHLSRLGDLEFERAVRHHINTCKWFPKVSELLQAVQDQGPSAIDIWNRLLAAAETGKKPEMDAATDKALAVLGGWEVFQYTSFEDLQWKFKDFKAALLEARSRDNLLVGGQAALEGPA